MAEATLCTQACVPAFEASAHLLALTASIKEIETGVSPILFQRDNIVEILRA